MNYAAIYETLVEQLLKVMEDGMMSQEVTTQLLESCAQFYVEAVMRGLIEYNDEEASWVGLTREDIPGQ